MLTVCAFRAVARIFSTEAKDTVLGPKGRSQRPAGLRAGAGFLGWEAGGAPAAKRFSRVLNVQSGLSWQFSDQLYIILLTLYDFTSLASFKRSISSFDISQYLVGL